MNKNYYSGRYGLVDSFYRHIWLNVDNEKVAHQIKNTFWDKTTIVVFDLTLFDNYCENLLDNEVSLNWTIPTTDSSLLLSASLCNPDFRKTQTTYVSKILLNEPGNSPITIDRKKDLQLQMMIYYEIFLTIDDFLANADQKFVNEINKIFQTELHADKIKEKLYQHAIDNYTNSGGISYQILDLFDRKYG